MKKTTNTHTKQQRSNAFRAATDMLKDTQVANLEVQAQAFGRGRYYGIRNGQTDPKALDIEKMEAEYPGFAEIYNQRLNASDDGDEALKARLDEAINMLESMAGIMAGSTGGASDVRVEMLEQQIRSMQTTIDTQAALIRYLTEKKDG